MSRASQTYDRVSYLTRLFRRFATREANPVAYVRSLIPFNLSEARRFATLRGRSWRVYMRDHLAAVRAAKRALKEMACP